jgi:multidrug resistance efflux pump
MIGLTREENAQMLATDRIPPGRVPSDEEQSIPPSHRSVRSLRVALVVVVIVLLAGAVWWRFAVFPSSQQPLPLVASGTIEADEVLISPKISGLLVALPVTESTVVQEGDVVAQLDDSLIRLQMRMADEVTLLQLQLQVKDYTLHSPTSGVITHVPMKVGEVVVPGETVVTVANPSHLKVTVYIPEGSLGAVQAGQSVRATADPYPDRAFAGVVTSINENPEFTPRNVQSKADRLNLVFGVQIDVANPDGALKAGMPVDVTFPMS